jgi:hypothetical protein
VLRIGAYCSICCTGIYANEGWGGCWIGACCCWKTGYYTGDGCYWLKVGYYIGGIDWCAGWAGYCVYIGCWTGAGYCECTGCCVDVGYC